MAGFDRKDLEKQLRELRSDLPVGRPLNLQEKLELIAKIGGPRTVRQIIKAKKTLQLSRIPFLFSSLDTQLVMDVLANEWEDALEHVQGK